MSWFFSKSPFAPGEDPVQHMVELLSKEAEKTGPPLTDVDKAILTEECSRPSSLTRDLRLRTKELIARIFDEEPTSQIGRDPKSFLNALQWAGDPGYPNIVMLAEEVARTSFPPPRGRKLVKDKARLFGWAVLVVLCMFAMVIGAGVVFGWK